MLPIKPQSQPLPQQATLARAQWLDFARVFATLLIVHFHLNSSVFSFSETQQSIDYVIHFFTGYSNAAITFFYLVAGYFTRINISIPQLLRKIACFVIVYLVWNSVYAFGLEDDVIFSRVYGVFSKNGVCADYPLWFVRDIIIMLCFIPIIKKIPYFALAFAFVFYFWDNNWHQSWINQFPFPKPSAFIFMIGGFIASRIRIEQLHQFLSKATPYILIASPLVYLSIPYVPSVKIFPAEILLSLYRVLFLCSLGILLQAYCPRLCQLVASQAKVCFLCFASHAGIIYGGSLLLFYYYPPLLHSIIFINLLPIIIFCACILAYKLMSKRIPILLPILAHEGKLPFLSKSKR